MKRKFDVAEKREYDELNMMAKLALELPAEDPRRKATFDFIRSEYAKFVDEVDVPAEPISVEKPLLGTLDWASGLARTTVGEAAKAGKALAQGEAPRGGLTRIGHAIASPYYGPAPGTAQYLEELGVPRGPSLGETSLGRGMGIAPGSAFDISPRGVVGFAGDVASGGAWRGVGKAGDKILGTVEQQPAKFLSGVEATAAAQRQKQAEFLEAMKGRISGNPKSLAKKAAVALNETIKGGPRYIGQELFKSRFSDLDQGNIETGKLPVSGVMMEHGGWGGSEKQILQDMRGVMDARNKLMQGLLQENAINPVSASDLFKKFYNDPDIQEALANPATSASAKAAIAEAEAMFAESVANNPNTIPGYRSTDPTIQRMHNASSGVVTPLEERVPGNPNFPKVDVLKKPEYSRGFSGMYGDPVQPNVEGHLLDALDPRYTGKQLHGLKKSFQNEAFNRGAYQSKDIANMADKTKNDMARLAMTKMGHYAGEALENALDTPNRQFNLFEKVPTFAAKPPVGAEFAKLNQDVASILTAAPEVIQGAGGGVAIPGTGYSTGDLWNATKIPLARTLMSGPAQYAPSVWRAVWLARNKRQQDESPYRYLKKVGEQ